MILSATGSELATAVAWVTRLCPSRPSVPHLGGVLMHADDEGLTLTCTDLDQWASVTVKAVVSQPGTALASGRLLVAVAKAAAKGDVHLEANGALTVTSGRSTWTIPELDHMEFPASPDLGKPLATLDGAELASALARVLPAANKKHEAPLYAGALLTGTEDELRILTTDGFRLADAAVPWRDAEELEMVVPLDLLDLAARTGGAGPVQLCTNGQVVSFASGTHRVSGRLIAEQAPRLRQIIPALGDRAHITADAASLIDAVESASVVVEGEGEPVLLEFEEDHVRVSLAEQGRSSAAEAPLSGFVGNVVDRILFRPGNLLDALRCCRSEQVLVSFDTSERKAVLVLPLGDDGEPEPGYLHLLMPVSEAHRKSAAR